jgi:hypothetical protein
MKVIDNVYGEQITDDEIIKKLIKTKEMQRLKDIHQHGTWHFIDPKFDTSRFEHSLGVYFLLRKFNASFEEQIAGLIHDISHFAFSHVIDYVFGKISSQEVAEKFNNKIIKKSLIPSILKDNNIDIDFILDKHNFKMLERDLPGICADRLDYLFRDSIIFGSANHSSVNSMLNSLLVRDDEFIISDEESAKKIAKLYLETSKKMWVNPLQSASYQILANAIKIALEKSIIKEKDFYLTDEFLLKKLKKSKDNKIIEMIKILENLNVKESNENDYDFHTTGKARYIDPKFLDGSKIKRVSEVDKKFKNEIKEFQQWVNKGFYVKIIR